MLPRVNCSFAPFASLADGGGGWDTFFTHKIIFFEPPASHNDRFSCFLSSPDDGTIREVMIASEYGDRDGHGGGADGGRGATTRCLRL